MNENLRGRLDKKRQIWSNSRQTEKADSREMVVLPRETFLEMDEFYQKVILSLVFIHSHEHYIMGLLV